MNKDQVDHHRQFLLSKVAAHASIGVEAQLSLAKLCDQLPKQINAIEGDCANELAFLNAALYVAVQANLALQSAEAQREAAELLAYAAFQVWWECAE